MRKSTLTYLLLIVAGSMLAQFPIQDVQWEKIPQKKVRKLIQAQQADGAATFSEVDARCMDHTDSSAYYYHSRIYYFDLPADQLWEAYKTVNPAAAWNGKLLQFGLLYDASSDQLVYPGDDYPGARSGQLVYVHLKLLGGLLKVATAHKITRVNDDIRRMRFCYLEQGNTEGQQSFQLYEEPDGRTRIEHISWFNSGSKLRDKRLYPHFHTKVIDDFHRNVVSACRQQISQAAD